jgi:predicted ATPase
MQLRHFECTNLNAFLTYQFDFFKDVTFLHGINGSGKTSILRAIASLLTPDPLWLATSTFDEIAVTIEHNGVEYSIRAADAVSEFTIEISGGLDLQDVLLKELIETTLREPEDAFWSHPGARDEDLSLRTKRVLDSAKTLSFIAGLPTPIFLGLDRTTLTATNNRPQRGRARSVAPYFRTSLDDALYEAERLLRGQLADLSVERNKLFEKLRNQLLLSLFQIPKAQGPDDMFKRPEMAQLQRMRTSVITALKKISITDSEIQSTVGPFFATVFAAAEQAVNAPELKKDNTNFQDVVRAIAPYINLQTPIGAIESAVDRIEKANAQERIIARPIETYTKIMDGFFADSRKTIVLEQNKISVRLPSGTTADITALSSGERQIFVLITHLVFNPRMRDENILLIDEPELSLHLKWQKGFVSAVRTASPAIQMILATHSPEIIFDLEDRMIPLEF